MNLSLIFWTMVAAISWPLAREVHAQTLRTLHDFTAPTISNGDQINSDGVGPGVAILCRNTLYGAAFEGGVWGRGTVFGVNSDGTDFTTIHTFANDLDGALPTGLILLGSTLYGTTFRGGNSGYGTVFKVNVDGTSFGTLYPFDAVDSHGANGSGALPSASLVVSDNRLYGTTQAGGSGGVGTVFAINTDGTGFMVLHNFPATSGPSSTNSDGAAPTAGLILSGGTLYGTTPVGGGAGYGTVFGINSDGSSFRTLHSFAFSYQGTNLDGAQPYAPLVLSGDTLYGTTDIGGIGGGGTVFKVNTNGSGFATLYSFAGANDGSNPDSGLRLTGETLYGAARSGGLSGAGTIFSVKTDGTRFTILHSFTALSNNTNSDGVAPSGLILFGNVIYGATSSGGGGNSGTIFSILLPPPSPQLTITHAGANVVLSWPTNATGFALQSATNLVPPTVWSTNLPAPMVINGQNTVTNPINGTQQFYRLVQ